MHTIYKITKYNYDQALCYQVKMSFNYFMGEWEIMPLSTILHLHRGGNFFGKFNVKKSYIKKYILNCRFLINSI